MDGNIKDTPPIVFVPQRRRPAALGRARQGRSPAAQAAARRPHAGRPRRLRQVARRGHARRRWPTRARRGPAPARPARARGRARPSSHDSTAAGGRSTLGSRRRRGSRATSRRRPSRSRPGATLELPDAGDFEKDQAFSYGAWVKLAQGRRRRRRRRPDGRRERLPRLGPLAREAARVGTHIIHKWPDDALKVVADDAAQAGRVEPRARHLRRLGQGRRRQDLRQRQAAAGRRRTPNTLKSTIRTDGPAQASASGSTASRLDGRRSAGPADLRPRPAAPTRSTQLARLDPRRLARREAGRQADRGRDERAVRLVAVSHRRRRFREAPAELLAARSRSRPRSRRGARSPT